MEVGDREGPGRDGLQTERSQATEFSPSISRLPGPGRGTSYVPPVRSRKLRIWSACISWSPTTSTSWRAAAAPPPPYDARRWRSRPGPRVWLLPRTLNDARVRSVGAGCWVVVAAEPRGRRPPRRAGVSTPPPTVTASSAARPRRGGRIGNQQGGCGPGGHRSTVGNLVRDGKSAQSGRARPPPRASRGKITTDRGRGPPLARPERVHVNDASAAGRLGSLEQDRSAITEGWVAAASRSLAGRMT